MAAIFKTSPRFTFKVFKFLPLLARRTMSSEEEKLVETEKLGNVQIITINRPKKRNCVNTATATQLYEAFTNFENDEDVRVAVLQGKGGTFCAGFDLVQAASGEVTGINSLPEGFGPMGPSRTLWSKPIIAAVAGHAVAGGLELALLCDMRVADETAVFGVFCRRFGVPLIDGGTVRLPQLIGLSRAMDMILTGRPVPAKEALQMGLANRVVPTGSALGEAVKIAQSIAQFPQECMKRDRISAYHATFGAKSLTEALQFEHNNAVHVIKQESIKGAGRFVKGVGRSGNFSDLNDGKGSKL